MGSSSSKAGRTAVDAARRQYPMQPSPSTREAQQATQQAIPQADHHANDSRQAQIHAQARHGLRGEPPSDGRNEAIDLDGRDPQLANALRQIGPVQPNPTYSPSSSASTTDSAPSSSVRSPPLAPHNPALAIMAARKHIEDQVEEDKTAMKRQDFAGRRYVDVQTIRKALMLRDEQGVAPPEIERILGLRKGAVNALGGIGVIEAA